VAAVKRTKQEDWLNRRRSLLKERRGKYIAIVVQARLGAHRFPNKVLEELEGKPVLWHLLRRLRASRLWNAIIVATPNKEIMKVADDAGVWFMQGDEEDVLSRYINAIDFCNADVIVRVTADCPLIDPWVLDETVERLTPCIDYVSNVEPRSYPKGLDVEVMWADVLKRIDRMTTETHHREHVTLFLRDQKELFRIDNVIDHVDNSEMDWTLDYPEELPFFGKIFKKMDTDIWGYKKIKEFCQNGESVAHLQVKTRLVKFRR